MRDAGLHRLTVSLDTLRADRFQRLTRFDELGRVLDGIATAAPLFPGLKLDTVVIRGVNDDELVDLLEFGRRHGAEVRFIEYMDVGGATHWSMPRVVSRREILAPLAARYGPVTPVVEESSAPADRYTLAGRADVRNHLVDDRAVLRELRSQPADGRRALVSVPVCRARHRPAAAAARGGQRRTPGAADSGDVGSAERPRRRGAPRLARSIAAHSRGSTAAGPAPRDAYPRRIARPRSDGGSEDPPSYRQFEERRYVRPSSSDSARRTPA